MSPYKAKQSQTATTQKAKPRSNERLRRLAELVTELAEAERLLAALSPQESPPKK